jgi:hypothetical protein
MPTGAWEGESDVSYRRKPPLSVMIQQLSQKRPRWRKQ